MSGVSRGPLPEVSSMQRLHALMLGVPASLSVSSVKETLTPHTQQPGLGTNYTQTPVFTELSFINGGRNVKVTAF